MRLLVFALIALWAGAAQAAVIQIKPKLVAVFDAQFNDITPTAVALNENGQVLLQPSAEPYTLQVDFSFLISDLQPGQLGFGNAAFNVNLGGDLTQSSEAPGWNPEAGQTVDNNGPAPGGLKNKWADNGDYGVAGDLQGIIIGTDPPDFGPVGVDPRRVFGRDGDQYFGNVFFELPGTIGSIGSLEVEGDGGSVYDVNNKLVATGVTVTGGSINFQVAMPEPSSAILLCLGGVMLAVVGRRFRR
jgi:hypothetical protein